MEKSMKKKEFTMEERGIEPAHDESAPTPTSATKPFPEPLPVSDPVPEKPAQNAPATRIDPADRLVLENLELKMKNIQLQLQIMQGELAGALREREATVAKMNAKRQELLAKYNIDVALVKIDDEGNVTPITPTKLPGMP